MSIKIIGKLKPMTRMITGWYSFDKAFENAKGEIGIPYGSLMELYGATKIGKTTVALSLSGLVNPKGRIVYAELEGIDPGHLKTILNSAGFSGEVETILEETDNITLEKLAESIPDGASVAILDTIGALIPVSEAKGHIGDSNMGKRALMLNQFARRIQRHAKFHDHKFLVIMINHQAPVIGGFGTYTPGGEGKKYAAQIRIALGQTYIKKKKVPYLIKGKVTKNRWGYDDREFYLYNLPGFGIHKGLTALFDCLILEHAEIKRTIQMDGNSFGYLKELLDSAKNEKNEVFEPFLHKVDTLYQKGDESDKNTA